MNSDASTPQVKNTCEHARLYACEANRPNGEWSTLIWCATCGECCRISPYENPTWFALPDVAFEEGLVVDILAWPGSDFETLQLLCLTFDERRALASLYDHAQQMHETILPKPGFEVVMKATRARAFVREVQLVERRYADAKSKAKK